MKKSILISVFIVLVICLGSNIYSQEKPRIGVLRFTNHVGSLSWWNGSVADELQDMLASELVSEGSFQVLERNEINAVFGEQDLSASGRVSHDTIVKMKRLKGAKYLIAGTVSAWEESGSKGGGISFKGISLGGKKDKTYIAVDVKVIDTETGEIYDARTIEASAKGSAIHAGVTTGDLSLHGGEAKKTPAGQAIRACIVYIAEYLSCSLVEGKNAPCMQKWNEMDSRRKDKTKSSIDLQ